MQNKRNHCDYCLTIYSVLIYYIKAFIDHIMTKKYMFVTRKYIFSTFNINSYNIINNI